jgi:hypothetical protein
MCLFSPQHMAQQTTSTIDGFHSMDKFGVLTFSGFKRTTHYNTSNNLPILFLASDFSSIPPSIDPLMPTSTSNISLLSSTSTDLDSFSNLSATQCKLLNIHYKMGHLHMAKIQQLARDGLFGRNLTTLGSCDIPLCRACAHGKQHHHAIPSHPAAGTLDISHLEPVD